MPSNYGGVACPKPEPRKRTKARAKRQAAKVVDAVRAACVERDGDCRIGSVTTLLGLCGGESEWAHLEEHRRFKTRGMPAEERHTVSGTAMLCTRHHGLYDKHGMTVAFLTERQADGPVRFTWDGVSILSVPR